MSQDTTNLLLIVFASVAIIGNIIAFLVARVELIAQRKETKALTLLTSELEHKVHRLATNLDHKIQRLERIKELVNIIWQTTIELNHRAAMSFDGKAEIIAKRLSSLPELQALADTINDVKLISFTTENVENVEDKIWETAFNSHFDIEKMLQLTKLQKASTRNMHQRILILIEQTTDNEEVHK